MMETLIRIIPGYKERKAAPLKNEKLMQQSAGASAIFRSEDPALAQNREFRLYKTIRGESGEEVLDFIINHLDLGSYQTQVISTTTLFNVLSLPDNFYHGVVNLRKLNDTRRINKFLEAINDKIEENGIFIGCVETLEQRKKRLINKFPFLFNRLYIFGDFIFKRVFPKLPITKQFYFAFTGGRNRVISRAEILGRVYSCGFEIIDEMEIKNNFYFVAQKKTEPLYPENPSYGPLFKMQRTGKGGKPIFVYKFRTMYPFSEYLQKYVYEKNKLDNGGKFKDDFRITALGAFMRKVWLDEVPMLLNVIKGDLNLVGVRPLSSHYQSLYPQDLLETRHKIKPGLVPPFYADMPVTFEEIVESERRYLQAHKKNPILTDIRYFFKAFYNILFKNARSR